MAQYHMLTDEELVEAFVRAVQLDWYDPSGGQFDVKYYDNLSALKDEVMSRFGRCCCMSK